jgi:hypothetical protein
MTATFVALLAMSCGGQTIDSTASSQSAGGRGGSGFDGGSGTGGSPTSDANAESGSGCDKNAQFERSCQSAADCVAAGRMLNCCGQFLYMGINRSELNRFAANESVCESGFPGCGCAIAYDLTDDGSKLPVAEKAQVTCLGGICTTYREACGAPCATGEACHSCSNHLTTYNACSPSCQDTPCADPARPKCQADQWGEMFCTESSVACGTE